jgi:hypothetical protein
MGTFHPVCGAVSELAATPKTNIELHCHPTRRAGRGVEPQLSLTPDLASLSTELD